MYVCRYNAHMYVRIYNGMYVRTVGITHTCMYVFMMVYMYACRYNEHMYVRIYDGYVCTYSRYNALMYVRIYDGMYVRV